MNIFILDSNPAIAASYHCDQHLHKMILESAQMLSTVARHYGPNSWDNSFFSGYYKPTHQNHPCTEWLRQSLANCEWLVNLCRGLEEQRLARANCDLHAASKIVQLFFDDFLSHGWHSKQTQFVFAGPLQIAIRPDLDIVAKYRAYYKLKNAQWIKDGKGPMSWTSRTKPEWMES